MTDPADLERVQLTRRTHLWQRRRGHRTATDDVLCAWCGLVARPDARTLLDLGAGQGSVALMLAEALPAASVLAVEVQEISWRLLVRNVAESPVATRVEPLLADLRRPLPQAARGGFDLVTGSPPFLPPGAGTRPRDEQRAAARFELRGGIEAYCHAAARYLAPDGVASLLMDGAQDARCRAAIAAVGLALAGRTSVHPVAGAPARYIIYAATRRPAEAGPFERALTVRRADGAWTEGFREVRVALDLPGA